MNFTKYLDSLENQEISLATQQTAQTLLTELQSPPHLDRVEETGESLIRAMGEDLIDLTVAIPMRARAYRLYKQLGLSTFQALRHASPAKGIATAVLVVP